MRREPDLYGDCAPFPHFFPAATFALTSPLFLPFQGSFPVSALLTGSLDEIREKAEIAKEHSHVKLKIGHLSLGEAIKIANELIGKYPFKIRIDINRNYSPEDAIAFGKYYPKNLFDYIEEPMPSLYLLPDYWLQTKQPFALDEHLLEKPLEQLLSLQGLKALILKPTILGGFFQLRPYILKAREVGIQCILSSCFESPIGILQILSLQRAFHLKGSPGLDLQTSFPKEVGFVKDGILHAKASSESIKHWIDHALSPS